IIGAGPAGLEAARVAALRGHTVEVFDKNRYLGGVLWPAATPVFKRAVLPAASVRNLENPPLALVPVSTNGEALQALFER
ncbi:MAG TPA: hypothetical protein DFS52_09135, partial [Myxococcales bacterium]|nr:hypothetical protein [Myxococcales bacterium]